MKERISAVCVDVCVCVFVPVWCVLRCWLFCLEQSWICPLLLWWIADGIHPTIHNDHHSDSGCVAGVCVLVFFFFCTRLCEWVQVIALGLTTQMNLCFRWYNKRFFLMHTRSLFVPKCLYGPLECLQSPQKPPPASPKVTDCYIDELLMGVCLCVCVFLSGDSRAELDDRRLADRLIDGG